MSIMVITIGREFTENGREAIESGAIADASGAAVRDIIRVTITPPVTAEVTVVRRDTIGINVFDCLLKSLEWTTVRAGLDKSTRRSLTVLRCLAVLLLKK